MNAHPLLLRALTVPAALVLFSPAALAQTPAVGDTALSQEEAPAAGSPDSASTAEPDSTSAAPVGSSQQGERADIERIVVVGSRRSGGRTILDSPVAIDVLDLSRLSAMNGQVDLNQLLHLAAPSFNANRQSGADGADHVDPATLRGLGPDQTLVLVNGKRRHQSSLINIFGARGRGNTGTDLNAIPIAAIERIEILRDGASAQYGSDAIAGVINIVLKSSVEELSANATLGAHNAHPPSSFDALRDERLDGTTYQLNANYGLRVADAGFLNLTAEYLGRERTTRAADPAVFDMYRREFGDAAVDNFGAFLNGALPLGSAGEVYAFGGYNRRNTDSYAWTRTADDDRNVPAIYPDGFDPLITSAITDYSGSAGFRTELGDWRLDVNNTFGHNRFHYGVDDTLNTSLLEESPTSFDAGGHELTQNTTGVYASRLFPGVLNGTNVAGGLEYRLERFQIFAGEEGSYRNYDPSLGKPGGAQGFPGFQPANEVDETRSNLAGYVDAEVDFTPELMATAAVRAERYSDFGSTLTAKLAGRWSILENVALRASATSGFRAPSLAQIHYNTTFTDFVSGQAVDKLIAKNDSAITRALGIPTLREETSLGGSAGLTVGVGGFSASFDGYYINIQDRIVLTGAFGADDPDIGADLAALGVSAAQFFANALDTETLGLDALLTYDLQLAEHQLRFSFAGNFNHMELGKLETGDRLRGKEDTFFGEREEKFLLASAPRSKLNLGVDYRLGSFGASARLVRFDEVVLIDWTGEEDVYDPRITTDVSFSYHATPSLLFVVGGENVFNVYPTQQDAETETGGLWDAVQMGFSGAFYFARVGVKM